MRVCRRLIHSSSSSGVRALASESIGTGCRRSSKRSDGGRADAHGRRVGRLQLGVRLLQRAQLAHQRVVLGVADASARRARGSGSCAPRSRAAARRRAPPRRPSSPVRAAPVRSPHAPPATLYRAYRRTPASYQLMRAIQVRCTSPMRYSPERPGRSGLPSPPAPSLMTRERGHAAMPPAALCPR